MKTREETTIKTIHIRLQFRLQLINIINIILYVIEFRENIKCIVFQFIIEYSTLFDI